MGSQGLSATRLAVVVGLVIGACVPAIGHASTTKHVARPLIATPPPNCNSSFDPYRYTAAAISACGFKTFPLTGTRKLPGGGTSYEYKVEGGRVSMPIPPERFRPLRASKAQLEEYGLPTRPGKGPALAHWIAEMRAWKGTASPPPFLTETHTRSGFDHIQSDNWSGYSASPHAPLGQASVSYLEPTIHGLGGCLAATSGEATWVGIGGVFPGELLAQDGTAWGVAGMAPHEAWWEIVGNGAPGAPTYNIRPAGLIVSSGERVISETTLGVPSRPPYLFVFRFFIMATPSGISRAILSFHAAPSPLSAWRTGYADAIEERPEVTPPSGVSYFDDLPEFGTLVFYRFGVNNGSGYVNSVGYSGESSTMYNAGNLLAEPGPLFDSGAFVDNWKRCA
jgi:hypothetical protein